MLVEVCAAIHHSQDFYHARDAIQVSDHTLRRGKTVQRYQARGLVAFLNAQIFPDLAKIGEFAIFRWDMAGDE